MKHMKTVEVPATKKEVVDRTTCDFCGAVLHKKRYEFVDVTLSCDEGSRYPGSGYGTKNTFDCCGACWRSKVLPALTSLAANGEAPRTEEWEY